MPVVAMRATAEHTISLAEQYLGSYRPRALGDEDALKVYRAARDLMTAKLAQMGVHKISLMSPRQLRHFAGWLRENINPDAPSPIMLMQPGKKVTQPTFGRRKKDPDPLPPDIFA